MSTATNFPSLTGSVSPKAGEKIELPTVASTAVFNVLGLESDSVAPMATRNGTDWFPLEVRSIGDTNTPLTSIVADGIYRADTTGLQAVRADHDTDGTGDVTATITIVQG